MRGILDGAPSVGCMLWVVLCLWLTGACAADGPRSKPSIESTREHYRSDVSDPTSSLAPEPQANHSKAGADTVEKPGGGSAEASEASSSERIASKAMPLVARVAGQEIGVDTFVTSWMFRDSEAVREVLDRLVLDALVRVEASRLGVVLSQSLLERDWRETLEEFDAQVENANPGTTREQFIGQRLGLDPEAYLANMRSRREMDLMAARCVRAFRLESETIQARLIVVPDRETADRVEAGLAQGRPFEELAGEYSIDPSGDQGGRIPPVVRSRAAIAQRAFSTPLGEVSAPLKESNRYLYIKSEALNPGIPGPWSMLGPRVEASLAEQSIEDLEFVQWQAMAMERYEVDTRPMLELTGQRTR